MGPLGLTLAMTLTLNFQGQIWNWLYLCQKWSDCHEKKSEHIDWTQASNGTIGFDLGHDIDLEFSRSNMELAISLPKMVRLPRNEKRTHRLNYRLQMGSSGLTLAMTLTLTFQGQIWNWLYLCQKWSDCHETKTIWWPRSGVRIYQIVTGVTSVVDSSSSVSAQTRVMHYLLSFQTLSRFLFQNKRIIIKMYYLTWTCPVMCMESMSLYHWFWNDYISQSVLNNTRVSLLL